jgi:hypothetical protein
MQPRNDRAGERLLSPRERAFWALVAAVLVVWLFCIEGGLIR